MAGAEKYVLAVLMHNSRQKSATSALNNLENKVGLLRLIGLFKVNG